MPRAAASETKPEKKAKSSTSAGVGGTKKKPSAYNTFMKNELAKLKSKNPDQPHKERFKEAAGSWGKSKENPKNA